MKNYIAAGFDPARFWDISPRLFDLEMDGAALRAKVRRSEIWYSAMLPTLQNPPTHATFVENSSNDRDARARCLEQWDKIDAGLASYKKNST